MTTALSFFFTRLSVAGSEFTCLKASTNWPSENASCEGSDLGYGFTYRRGHGHLEISTRHSQQVL